MYRFFCIIKKFINTTSELQKSDDNSLNKQISRNILVVSLLQECAQTEDVSIITGSLRTYFKMAIVLSHFETSIQSHLRISVTETNGVFLRIPSHISLNYLTFLSFNKRPVTVAALSEA
jgi:hypothetical protein